MLPGFLDVSLVHIKIGRAAYQVFERLSCVVYQLCMLKKERSRDIVFARGGADDNGCVRICRRVAETQMRMCRGDIPLFHRDFILFMGG
jgi:hypothetical protein